MRRSRKRLVTFLLLGLALIHCVGCDSENRKIMIGGLFGDDAEENMENTFKYAVYRVSHERGLLLNAKLTYDIQRLPTRNSFDASKKVCNQIALDAMALFGPKHQTLAAFVNSACSSLQIPHIETRMDTSTLPPAAFSINLHPEADQLAKAYLDLIKHYGWEDMLIVYSSQEGLFKMQSLIRATSLTSGMTVIVRQADMLNMRSVLKEAKQKSLRHIIAELNVTETALLLKMALQEGMIDPYHHFLITNLDIELIDLDDYRHNYVNLTGFRLVDTKDTFTRQILDDMYNYWENTRLQILNGSTIPYQCALLFDAVLLFATAVKEAIRSINLPSPNSTCENSLPWEAGATLYNYLNTVETSGLTGLIKLQHGRRLDFRLDILELRETGLEKSGTWVFEKGANVSTKRYKGGVFGNKTLVVSTLLKDREQYVVTTLLEPPYVIMKEDQKKRKLYGNERFEGFCIDLLNEIAKIEGFDYKIELVPDGRYGVYDKATKQWDGMVRQLIDRKADMAIAALTISYEREQYIDFTKPFLNLGISILFKKPRPEKPGLFSFLNPLALDIWIYIVAAYILVSFTIFVLARFSPYEWYNPHPCNQDTDSVENAFTLSNSFWFTVGTLMQQGSDVNPRAVSTRIVGGTWWFFTLIIISSYTANLAAFLTVERMVSPIENADDLSRQTEIAYGTLAGGSTMTFFKDSKIETYQRMWNFMESKEPSVFAKTYEEGIQRVLQGKYAFFMESTAIEYITQRNCQLMQVGGFLDSKGYGIATPINSPLKDRLSMAILSLQEEGKIQVLYNKWWISTGKCNKDDKDNKANSLGVENVGGVFVVLIGGLTLAVCIAILEFTWKSKRNAREDKQSLCSEMAEELGFAVRCLGSSQKPRFKRRCSTCRGTKSHSSHCSIRDNPPIDSPNGIIQMRELHASPSQGRRFDIEYGREPIRKFSAGSYLHIDCSDTDA